MPPFSRHKVEKRGRPKSRDFPPWFHRVLEISRERKVVKEDYDQDMSDLEEEERGDPIRGYIWEKKAPILKRLPESCTDEDVKQFPKFNRQREKWKEELKRRTWIMKHEAPDMIEFDRARQVVVNAAYEELKQVRKRRIPPRIKFPAGKKFDLFSAEHMEESYHQDLEVVAPTRYVEFYSHPHDEKNKTYQCSNPSSCREEVRGQVYIDTRDPIYFKPFLPPARPDGDIVEVRKENGRGSVMGFRFISSDYLQIEMRAKDCFWGNFRPRRLNALRGRVYQTECTLRRASRKRSKRRRMKEQAQGGSHKRNRHRGKHGSKHWHRKNRD
ncbi:hypothetical protein PT974_00449 [Cladobotryum mycophilum]|uniref:Uncharacterized protein n=1 Tax=Cladobotryum mycophilum TaxID=491253 RepID=A0ABR0T138_9HYPO